MGEFVEDELLSVECRVGVGVEHEVVGISGQPERTEAVVGIKISQLNDPKSAVPLVLDRAEELVEGEGTTEPKARHGRRYGLLVVVGSGPRDLPVVPAAVDRGAEAVQRARARNLGGVVPSE